MRFEPKPLLPYTREEVEALLNAGQESKDVAPRNCKRFAARSPLADRKHALVLVLLDCSLHSGQLCG